MNLFKNFFGNKLFKIGMVGMAFLGFILTIAFMGPTIKTTPKDLPVALVVNDEGVDQNNKEHVDYGVQIINELTKSGDSPINWVFIKSKEKAIEEMNKKKYYATIVLPENLSLNLTSISSENPQQAKIEVIINEGKNYQVANITRQLINDELEKINALFQTNLLNQLENRNEELTILQVKLLTKPFNVDNKVINEVGHNTANGNISGMFPQILWLITFLGSMLLFIMIKKATKGNITFGSIVTKLIAGFIFSTIASLIITLVATYVLDVNITNLPQTFFFLLFTGYMFFLLQNAVLNWLGFKGVPLILLLFFFSLPILTMAPELMSTVTYKGIYVWNPMLHGVEVFRSIYFFDGYGVWNHFGILAIIGVISLLLLFLSTVKSKKNGNNDIQVR